MKDPQSAAGSYVEVYPAEDYSDGLAQLARLLRGPTFDTEVLAQVADWGERHAPKMPTLLLDETRIEQRLSALADVARAAAVEPLLAVKSLPEKRFLSTARGHLSGFDVSNAQEYAVLPKDLHGQVVSVTSPVPCPDLGEFTRHENALLAVLDSPAQCLAHLASSAGVPYLLRLNASELVPAENAGHLGSSRFGLGLEAAAELISQQALRQTPPAGFHVHNGSELNDAETFLEMLRGLRLISEKLPERPTCMNLGGGWHGLDLDSIATVLTAFRAAFPAPCRLFIEPGQWCATGAVYALGRIENLTVQSGRLQVVANLSRGSHMHWSQPRWVCSLSGGSNEFCEVTIYGASCYEGDVIGRYFLPIRASDHAQFGLVPGAPLLFSGLSIYSAAWNRSFNGIPAAALQWYRGGD